jgi:High-temperature-induced dauer-formation protein
MGASDSKLVFKQGIFRLSEEKGIAPNDPYWSSVRLSFLVNILGGYINLTEL